ncbi:integral membrane efflux protein [Staphylococcus aureus]|uniref:Integral membrane efflux protein n=1 Tax=Staphylococcus aureus TaxID=1280 RepID=A0A380DT13_STAAU|nr:integral membrane efflux protein [Staphylococcus aureus]
MDTSKQFRGDNRLLLGIVLGVITFWLFAQSLVILLSHYNQHIVVTLER